MSTDNITPQQGNSVQVDNSKLYECVKNISDQILEDCVKIVKENIGQTINPAFGNSNT